MLAPSNAEEIASHERAVLCGADKYEVQSARIAGDSCIVASGKQLSSGCAVVLKFFVDEDDFLHLKRFHHQARDAQYIPGKLASSCNSHSPGTVHSCSKPPALRIFLRCLSSRVGIVS